MLKKITYFFAIFFGFFLFFMSASHAEINAKNLLKPQEAFVPQLVYRAQGASIQFAIAEGYYLYRSKIAIETNPPQLFAEPQFSLGTEKTDEFFGTQEIYRDIALINLPLIKKTNQYQLTLHYQGCADVGICYPPVKSVFHVNGEGIYTTEAASKAKSPFLQSTAEKKTPLNLSTKENAEQNSRFQISWNTLGINLLAFFVAGLALAFTACMYPLLPIVSSIVLGAQAGKGISKTRAFALSFIYVQGLALTYTAVGVIAGLSGALLTVWLQQPWVILSAAVLMLLLALSMFGLFSIQLPSFIQQYFSNKSSALSGGKIISVFLMGMFSALIVGPCVAPPLAFALAYIGQSGDGVLGGLALYAMAIGTGVPLMLVAIFGAHFLPRAGGWMKGVQIFFGCMLLAVAVYLATPFIPYVLVIAAYSLIMLIPGGLLLIKSRHFTGSLKTLATVVGILLLIGSLYFAYASTQNHSTVLHRFLTLNNAEQTQAHGVHFTERAALQAAIHDAFTKNPDQPVYVDFYADWCISCKEMATHTFSQPEVWDTMDETRFFQIDVTDNTEDHQQLLKEYGLFGPPGFFVLHSPSERSEPLLGFAPPEDLLQWLAQQKRTDAVSLPH